MIPETGAMIIWRLMAQEFAARGWTVKAADWLPPGREAIDGLPPLRIQRGLGGWYVCAGTQKDGTVLFTAYDPDRRTTSAGSAGELLERLLDIMCADARREGGGET